MHYFGKKMHKTKVFLHKSERKMNKCSNIFVLKRILSRYLTDFFCVLMEVVRHPGIEQSPLVVKKGLVSSRIKQAIRVKKCTLSIKKHKGQKRDIAYLCNIR